MIVQDIYIKRAGWHVKVYHAVDAMFVDDILDELISIGCSGDTLRKAKQSLWRGAVNSGLTYSNLKKKETIMVVGLASSGAEYWNSLEHEMRHLLQHIEDALGLDHYGEEISYISGEFIRDVYDGAKDLLCECCRNRLVKYKKLR